MFGILLSALYSMLSFLLRSILIKFVIFFALFYVVHEFTAVMLEIIPERISLTDTFNSLPDSVLYFIHIFRIVEGMNIFFSSLLTRFIIRRIPVIG